MLSLDTKIRFLWNISKCLLFFPTFTLSQLLIKPKETGRAVALGKCAADGKAVSIRYYMAVIPFELTNRP